MIAQQATAGSLDPLFLEIVPNLEETLSEFYCDPSFIYLGQVFGYRC
jgi:hypothetical protein